MGPTKQLENMTKKTALRRNFARSIAHSMGRFLSIVGLMALGSFALVGLLVSGPDMRATARTYFDELHLADVTVLSDLGLDENDVALINEAPGAVNIEYGYFKDVAIDGTATSVRVESLTQDISQAVLVAGEMPTQVGEIALDSAMADTYQIGDTIQVTEKPDAISGDTVLTCTDFRITGFVNSGEILSSVNMGQSTAGTGSLKGLAVVVPETFDSDIYMLARLTYTDTAGVDPYSDEYRDLIQAHKEDLETLLAERPAERLASVKGEAQDAIDEGQTQVDDARAELSDASAQLDEAAAQIADAEAQIQSAKHELSSTSAAARAELDANWAKLADAKITLDAGRAQLNAAAAQITDGETQLADARAELEEGEAAYAAASQQVAAKRTELEAAQAELEHQYAALEAAMAAGSGAGAADPAGATVADASGAITGAGASAAGGTTDGSAVDPTTAAAALEEAYAQLEAGKAQLEAGQAELVAAEQELAQKRTGLDAAAAEIAANEQQLAQARADYETNLATYNTNLEAYNQGVAACQAGEQTLAQQTANAEAQISAAESELSANRAEYTDALNTYKTELPNVEAQIADAEQEIVDAQERADGIAIPVYNIDSRSETPGSDAYGTYKTISEVIDSLARVFPVFLYLVAALVTLTTMTRMVDEERVISGTFKALGYSDVDVALKFVCYGALAGGIGTIIGVTLGHTLFPWIVYSTYAHSFMLPPLEFVFYPGVTVLALVLAALCSVLPAWVAARREMRAHPAELLLPKAPRGGSKILLEHVRPIWSRLSFTHKVTARNLFRYKQRMLMTVVGVAGAVAILVTGFGVQASIQQMGTRQFGTIIKYNMIVADSSSATASERAEIGDLLNDSMVAHYTPIHYESISRVAAESGDRQDITLIVPDDPTTFSTYVQLADRRTAEPIELGGAGAVISERLANLFGLKVGDVMTFTDGEGAERSVTIIGITEMYMGHFMFLSPAAYEAAFGTPYASNASLVTLADSSTQGVEDASTRFMELAGVKGVVQNTSLQSQVDTIVNALNKIMVILIVVAAMLGIVIMYNLTNLNVSERMRELSTIKVLGFHNNETTMYIYRETIVLTALGMLVGFAIGVALHEYVLWVVPPDNVMFNPALSAIEFVVPCLVTIAITVLLYFVVLRRLAHVDMLEALKSVD